MPEFNLETIMKIMPVFTGNYKELDCFLKLTELLYDTYSTDDKKKLIDLIVSIKLTAKVITLLGYTENIYTLNKLKTGLNYFFEPT